MTNLFKAAPRYHAALKECETVTQKVIKFSERLKTRKNTAFFKEVQAKTTT